MDRFIAKQNIDRFRRQLAETQDPTRRESIGRLLAEAEDHLREVEAAHAHRSNLSSLVDQFRNESDPAQRDMMRRRLIEEEDRFGELSHRIDVADGFIEDGARRVERLQALLSDLAAKGLSTASQAATLNNSKEILEVFMAYRAVLADRAGRIEL